MSCGDYGAAPAIRVMREQIVLTASELRLECGLIQHTRARVSCFYSHFTVCQVIAVNRPKSP
jgi:hypothetical protein